MTRIRKQTLTLSPIAKTAQKAKALAAKCSTSMSDLLTKQIEVLVDSDGVYKNAHKEALDLMKEGLHLGGNHSANRLKSK